MAPNGAGTHPEELKQVERLVFAKIAPIAESFAEKHRLLIRKYYHDGSSWDMMFKKKTGGTGMIEILLTQPGISVLAPETLRHLSALPPRLEFTICATCWIDDYDTQMRSGRHEEVGKFLSGTDPQEKMIGLLELALKKTLSWNATDLTERSGPNQWKNTWKTNGEFEKATSSVFIEGEMRPLPVM